MAYAGLQGLALGLLGYASLDPSAEAGARQVLLLLPLWLAALVGVLLVLETVGGGSDLKALSGWVRQAPVTAVALAIAVLVAIGLPASAAFEARRSVADIALGSTLGTLALLAVVTSVAAWLRLAYEGLRPTGAAWGAAERPTPGAAGGRDRPGARAATARREPHPDRGRARPGARHPAARNERGLRPPRRCRGGAEPGRQRAPGAADTHARSDDHAPADALAHPHPTERLPTDPDTRTLCLSLPDRDDTWPVEPGADLVHRRLGGRRGARGARPGGGLSGGWPSRRLHAAVTATEENPPVRRFDRWMQQTAEEGVF